MPPDGSDLEVAVFSRTDEDPLRHVTVHDDLDSGTGAHTNADCFSRVSPSFPKAAAATVDLTVPYKPAGETKRPSIGFGILDVLVTMSEAIRVSTGTIPPLLHAYTTLGNNGAVGTTFYDTGSGAITVLGGAAGNLDTTDTDYFDDPVLAHEFGHFVEFALAHSLNRGGSHSGEDLEPNFAWSEGQATGFGCAARADPVYIDSIGTWGNSAGSFDVENVPNGVRGIGSEQSVEEILWDLADGTGGVPDTDGDVAAVPLGTLYGALFSLSPSADAPYLGLFLERLVAAGVDSGTVGTLLGAPEDQQVSWPLAGTDLWPIALSIPGAANGLADSTIANPCRGRLASVWYRLDLGVITTIDLALDVQPIVGFGANLDLFLLDNAGVTLRVSQNSGSADESISNVTLAAGRYLVRVEANCSVGNKANFALTVN
jgi:hypothetical protein